MLNTYNTYYPGPSGEPNYYHVRAVEISPDWFNIYVKNTVLGYVANGTFSSVARAEDYIAHDRHRIATTP